MLLRLVGQMCGCLKEKVVLVLLMYSITIELIRLSIYVSFLEKDSLWIKWCHTRTIRGQCLWNCRYPALVMPYGMC